MPRLKAANNAETTLKVGITSTDTSLSVVDSSLFPDPPFRISVDAEIMEVGTIDRINHIFSNVQRGLEGTTAASHEVGAVVQNRLTAGMFGELADKAQDVDPKFDASTGHKHSGVAGDAPPVPWANVSGKPTTFPPSVHTHTRSQITDFPHKSTHASGGTDALTPADIGAETPSGAQAKANGKFISGAATSVDWNTLTTVGTNVLNLGNASNGPGPASYFHCVVLDYNGTGNITQLAIPYGNNVTPGIFMRGRYNGAWTSWTKFWTSANDGAGSGLDADNSDKLDGLHASSFLEFEPGDMLLSDNVGQKSTTSTTYTLLKSTKVLMGGTLRISFTMRSGTTNQVYGRIYRNGTPVGTERTMASDTLTTFVEDIPGWLPGDEVRLYARTTNSSLAVVVESLKISVSRVPSAVIVL